MHMRTIASAAGLALALSVAAPSQAAPANKAAAAEAERIKALEAKLEQSLALIQQLSQRVQELEKRPAPVAAAAPAAVVSLPAPQPAPDPRVDALEESVRGLSASATATATKTSDLGIAVHGFADAGYAHFNQSDEGHRNGFRLGTFDLYLTPQFGSNVRSLIELAFEYDSEGGLATDLERLQLGYAFNDNLVVWAGRYHTPYGYWNTAFHHGAQIQTSITRPRFLGFEDTGGILPAHAVGVWASGKAPTSLGKFTYDLYAANGNRIVDGVLDFQASGDDNKKPLLGFNVGFSPRALPGLTLGLHGLAQQVGGEGGAHSGVARTRMLGGYGYWEGDGFEVLGEFYQFRNRTLELDGVSGAGSHRSRAGYLQGGYAPVDGLMAYARYERAGLNRNDPYFLLQESGSSYSGRTFGLRWDLDPRSALKFEFQSLRDEGAEAIRALRAQYSIRF